MSSLVYFSSSSDNTHRFVQKLGLPAERIPLLPSDPFLHASEPYVLILRRTAGATRVGQYRSRSSSSSTTRTTVL